MEPSTSPSSSVKRERRQSPASFSFPLDEPLLSPSSSLSGDATFEPTIDMMVNDFDDEQTLNEEETLANLESQNPEDEIATLKEESEMPLEMLLAKYGNLPPMEPTSISPKKTKRQISTKRKKVERQQKNYVYENGETDECIKVCNDAVSKCAVEDSQAEIKPDDEATASPQIDLHDSAGIGQSPEVKKAKRSHLYDLYPDESFIDTKTDIEDDLKYIPLEILYNDVGDEEEDDDSDTDSSRKSIMVGIAYQALIPPGLSQYGDILPYENEDKLIWEPSQVSEREVEDFLLKVQEMKHLNTSEEEQESSAEEIVPNAKGENNGTDNEKKDTIKQIQTIAKTLVGSSDLEQLHIVKDNEQALHLLVQCGYDFNEALRRKRLNALPLSDSMSSWSEEECQKFEEGIQKFGKDFLKIRQSLVRTRTMREMVQFYYLWKKSERRDLSFAKADTIDQMEVYLNESGADFGSSSSQNGTGATGVAGVANSKKSSMKNYSIMTGGNPNCSESTIKSTLTESDTSNDYNLTNKSVSL